MTLIVFAEANDTECRALVASNCCPTELRWGRPLGSLMFLNRGVGLGKDGHRSKRYPKEFRDDVVSVARKGDTKLSQLATDFGVSEASIYNWMKQADVNDGV